MHHNNLLTANRVKPVLLAIVSHAASSSIARLTYRRFDPRGEEKSMRDGKEIRQISPGSVI
jgi:hypothetical protein